MASSVLHKTLLSRGFLHSRPPAAQLVVSAGAQARFSASEQTFVPWLTELVEPQARRTATQPDARRAACLSSGPAACERSSSIIAIIVVYRENNLMILTTCSPDSRLCLCPVQVPSASSFSGLLSNVVWCKQTIKNYCVSAIYCCHWLRWNVFFFFFPYFCLCSLPVQVQCPVLRLPHLSAAHPALPGAHEHDDAG